MKTCREHRTNAQKIISCVTQGLRAHMTCQLNFSPSPHDPHKDPTRSAPTKDELKRPQKGVGRPLGPADPLLSPIRPFFGSHDFPYIGSGVLGARG